MTTATLPSCQFYHQSSNDDDNSITLQSLRLTGHSAGAEIIPVILQTIRQEDESSVLAILAEPENTKDDLSVANLKPEELATMIRSWVVRTDPLASFQFLVTIANKPVGIAGFGWIGSGSALVDNGKPAQIGAAGVVINPDTRGHGYGFEALRIVIDYGLRNLRLDKIVLGTTSRNTPMQKLMEDRFGMPATITKPDRFGNDLEWSITQSIWATWLTRHGQPAAR